MRRKRRDEFPEKVKQTAAEEYLASGQSASKIAAKYKTSNWSVLHWSRMLQQDPEVFKQDHISDRIQELPIDFSGETEAEEKKLKEEARNYTSPIVETLLMEVIGKLTIQIDNLKSKLAEIESAKKTVAMN